MKQYPLAGDFLLKWRGDSLKVTLELEQPQAGRVFLRTNLGNAADERREIIEENERGITPLARGWHDLPMTECAPGRFELAVGLSEVGVFAGKTCFVPADGSLPQWPEGEDFRVKVESSETCANNSIYCVFPRQFGSFREVIRRLDLIMGRMGFRIIQTLPPFPVPTTYAVMGEYGCPFAATDFFSVDPSLGEFDEAATPFMQFLELIGAVHARDGLMLVDLPANHTGWASTLQTHHPEWFRKEPDGRFHSPGAWGVKWADLVELDYSHRELREYMAEVFVYWCRMGIDGFRCDAGYMIPADAWRYIVARVREEYPDTIFLLEGLGGELAVTDRLLADANLDWAYSEIFQTYDRRQFEAYLPAAIRRSERYGALVHFAETHDNDRLAKGGEIYARLRVQLAALLSWQGAWGIANGVEWLATEKIDVHGKNDLNWGAEVNLVELIAGLNAILRTHPTFTGAAHLELITRGGGNVLAVLRQNAQATALVLANLDCRQPAIVEWDPAKFPGEGRRRLAPGEVVFVAGRAQGPALTPWLKPVGKTFFHLEMPRDATREAVVPEHQPITLVCGEEFRLRVVEPKSGRTLKVLRSHSFERVSGRPAVVFTAPDYEGDGTRCRRLQLVVTRYVRGVAVRLCSALLVPPPPDQAQMQLALSGEALRAHPEYRTILSNGAGAAAQIRLGWGEIRSQYDALLAANPNPTCPSDRINLWTRLRCWLQHDGYSREFDVKVQTGFAADPSGRSARWRFAVPCGLGLAASFEFVFSLVEGKNAAVLEVRRIDGGEFEVGKRVRLVFRPDVENRSFHATTKAYQVERDFSCPLVFTLENAVMHEEGQWTYNVGHPEEAARGQSDSGDLFSPGWISAELNLGESCVIRGEWQ